MNKRKRFLNKKAQERLIKGLIIGIILISIFSLVFVLAGEGENITNSGNAVLTENAEGDLINYKFDWGGSNITLYKLVNSNYAVFNSVNLSFNNVYTNEFVDVRIGGSCA